MRFEVLLPAVLYRWKSRKNTSAQAGAFLASQPTGWSRICSIKVEVKKKHFCAGWSFSCFSAHWMEQDLFYKGGSQEKTLLRRLELFLLLSPLAGAGAVMTARTRCSLAGHCSIKVEVKKKHFCAGWS